jgi:hypothetical protein
VPWGYSHHDSKLDSRIYNHLQLYLVYTQRCLDELLRGICTGHDIQEMGAALPSAHDFIQFPWDPGSHLQHQPGGKPSFKVGGMLGMVK